MSPTEWAGLVLIALVFLGFALVVIGEAALRIESDMADLERSERPETAAAKAGEPSIEPLDAPLDDATRRRVFELMRLLGPDVRPIEPRNGEHAHGMGDYLAEPRGPSRGSVYHRRAPSGRSIDATA